MNNIQLIEILQEVCGRLSDLEKESLYLKTKGIIPDWKNELNNLTIPSDKPETEDYVPPTITDYGKIVYMPNAIDITTQIGDAPIATIRKGESGSYSFPTSVKNGNINTLKTLIFDVHTDNENDKIVKMKNIQFNAGPNEMIEQIVFTPNHNQIYKVTGYLFFCNLKKIEQIDLRFFDLSDTNFVNFAISGCSNLKKIVDLENKTFSRPLSECGFANNSSLKELIIPNFQARRMRFGGGEQLEYIDLSNCDTSKITDYSWTFLNCPNLKKIDAVFDFSSCNNYQSVQSAFKMCPNLSGVKIKNIRPELLSLLGLEENQYEIVD